MTERRDLLIEVGTEELPPKSLAKLSDAFAGGLAKQLGAAGLTHGKMLRYATPRRLALLVEELAGSQADQKRTRRGPSVSAGFGAEGQATKAALGFARSCGVDVSELSRERTEKGEWLVHHSIERGRSTIELLPELAGNALAELPIPKRMRWGDGDVTFVRPVQWICMLFGAEAVPGQLLGLPIGQVTRGHRFHHPQPISVRSPGGYAPALRGAFVEPDFAVRRDHIRQQVEALAESVGGSAHMPEALLDEVTALCEWPMSLLGRFDESFLQIPAEALIETMQQHQKYFSVHDADGRLLPNFITVSNIQSRAPDLVRAGNERVIRPRFSDAQFFWEQDLRVPLEDRATQLDRIVFQHRLGSVGDKVRRVRQLSREIATQLGYDPALVERAALLSKCDLVTAMVSEFASLQGTMGRHYAEKAGEVPCVTAAMDEQYLPRHAGDRLPTSDCGRALAIADKLDSLLGIFSIGERPTGVKDPFALRRAAIGVLRILIEQQLPLDLLSALQLSAATFPQEINADSSIDSVFDYVNERLPGYYSEQGIDTSVVDAVMSVGVTMPSDFDRRVRAVSRFMELDAAQSLAAANKRIANILKKPEAQSGAEGDVVDDFLVEPEEQALAHEVRDMSNRVKPLLELGQYETALTTLASLKNDVDRFFDKVMVMDEDQNRRNNRLALLNQLRALFATIADISKVSTPERQ